MTRLLKGIAVALVVAGFTSAASAAVSLNYLVNTPGATIQQGDKIFGNFTWTGPTGPTGFNVSGIGDGTANNLYGIEIQGAFLQAGAGSSDWSLGYSVSVAPGYPNLISDIHQYANFTGTLGSLVNITEDALNAPGGVVVASSHLGQGINYTSIDQTDPPAELNDTLNLSTPLSTIWIKKDILLAGQNPTDYSVASIIDQRFSQSPVPEPTTLFAGLGALVVVFAGLRSRGSTITRIDK